MSDRAEKIRLYVDAPLGAEERISLAPPQAHYLNSVMRCQPGDSISVFNGSDGDWAARVVAGSRRSITLLCQVQTAPQRMPPDLWLVFAPLRKSRTDFVVEKATELGVRRIFPVRTEFTVAARVSERRLQSHAIEAAQQCGENHVPPVSGLQGLETVLDTWPAERQLLFCDEARMGRPVTDLTRFRTRKWAILIGPVGGFSKTEASRIRSMPQSVPMSLGPRILRADTAAVAAIALWQASLGDWQRQSESAG
ncbi:MAG: 16S rRNA (uracil(1498)-N(3))-methyltransferase [Rhodobacteraceae bacterium]|nr:16S rRNA (uracil(1498)-N(3))-methyltransferase [Paracoccaceae bacterium]